MIRSAQKLPKLKMKELLTYLGKLICVAWIVVEMNGRDLQEVGRVVTIAGQFWRRIVTCTFSFAPEFPNTS